MKANLRYDDNDKVILVVEPESSTEAVAMTEHGERLGFVFDPDTGNFVRKETP